MKKTIKKNADQTTPATNADQTTPATVTAFTLCAEIDSNLYKTSALVASLVTLTGSDSKAKSAFLSYLKTLVVEGQPAFSPNTTDTNKRPANYADLMKRYNRFAAFFRDEKKRADKENGTETDKKERSIDAIVSTFISTLKNKGMDSAAIIAAVQDGLK